MLLHWNGNFDIFIGVFRVKVRVPFRGLEWNTNIVIFLLSECVLGQSTIWGTSNSDVTVGDMSSVAIALPICMRYSLMTVQCCDMGVASEGAPLTFLAELPLIGAWDQ